MPNGTPRRVLTINTGSSSLKAGLYRIDGVERREAGLEVECIGRPGGHARAVDPDGHHVLERAQEFPDHAAAMTVLLDWLRQSDLDEGIEAVGHRVVHGGPDHATPQFVSDALLAAVRRGARRLSPSPICASIPTPARCIEATGRSSSPTGSSSCSST